MALLRRSNLRSSSREPKTKVGEGNTFQNQAVCYNELPEKVRQSRSISTFAKEARKFYIGMAPANFA